MNRAKSRGFLPLTGYLALAAALAFAAVSGYGYVQSKRADAAIRDLATFKATVEAQGKAAEIAARKQESEDKLRKEKIDRENKTLRANLAAARKRLLDSAAASSLPQPAPGAASPDRITFDRAQLDGALQRFTAGVAGIVSDGDAAVIDLNSARAWANHIQ